MSQEGARDHERLLTPAEVASMFRVDPKTVSRWARAGKLPALKTLGGHRRFRAADVEHALESAEEGPDMGGLAVVAVQPVGG